MTLTQPRSIPQDPAPPAPILDAQVHLWHGFDWPASMRESVLRQVHGARCTPTEMTSSIRSAGVDSAIVVVPSWCGWNNDFALTAARTYPGRFAVVGRIDPRSACVRSEIARWAAEPAAVGLRLTSKNPQDWAGGSLAEYFNATAEFDVPVCVYPGVDKLHSIGHLAHDHGCRLIVDHAGLPAPPVVGQPTQTQIREGIGELIALAAHPNVSVKITGLPALSHQAFPFRDIWPILLRILDAFGADRVMWGTDITRTRAFGTHLEQVRYIDEIDELSQQEREKILGTTATRTFGWEPIPASTETE
ncbi:amidohydrolase family protein [Rhodococcus koreensis]|uniref:amidohydrolase family protein n=1 Tax=Rhodococcus koreensis TaxID=99653 RepID=UPI0036D9ACF9